MDTRDFQQTGEIVAYQAARPLLVAAASRPQAVTTAGPSLSFRTVTRGLLRWWWQASLVWIVGTVVGVAAIYTLFVPIYEASSLLRVEPTAQELFGTNTDSNNGSQNYLETQVQLITSANVLLTAASNTQVAGLDSIRKAADPEILLRRMIEVKILPKSFLLEVSTSSKSPVEAAAVVNAVVDVYLKADAEWSDGMTRTQIKNLESYQQGLQTQVDEKQKAWLELAAKGNLMPDAIVPPRLAASEPSHSRVSVETYQDLRQRLLETELDLTEAEAVDELRRTARPQPSKAELDRRIEQEFRADPEVGKILDEIQKIEIRRATLDRKVRDSLDPAVVHAGSRFANLMARYKHLWASKYDEVRGRVLQSPDLDPTAAREAVSRVVALRKSKSFLEAKLDGLTVTGREQSTDTVRSVLIQSDLKRLEEMQTTVSLRLEQFRFEARGLARIRRISEARPPARAASDKRPKLMAAAPAMMLGLIVCLTTLLEARAGRVSTPDDLIRRINADIFAVPELPSARPARMLARPRSVEEMIEDFGHRMDHIREAICGEIGPGRPGRCVVISSAVGGEGKTTLASQLALRCSNAGARTVLIDADLRRGSLGRLLGVPECPGLVDLLKNDAELENCLVPLGQAGFHFLPAGKPEPNPARFLYGRQISALLSRLRTTHEVVIIDTPPVLPVADALTLARWCDGVVLATLHETSRVKLVDQASQLFRSHGIPLLGVVVQGVPTSGMTGGHYRYISI